MTDKYIQAYERGKWCGYRGLQDSMPHGMNRQEKECFKLGVKHGEQNAKKEAQNKETDDFFTTIKKLKRTI